jgi:hypothetical protein
MASWVLIKSLTSLRAELDKIAPKRSKVSDGSIGDAKHKTESSDHNPDDTAGSRTPGTDRDSIPEVHAIDATEDLRQPGWSMDRVVQIVVLRHRTGLDDRLQNVIHKGIIWSRSWGWTARKYNGTDQHYGHAHFSGRYGSGSTNSNPENDTKPWGLLAADGDDDMDATEAREAAKLGMYDALKMAALATDGDASNDTPTSRQLKGFINTLLDARINAAVKPLGEKIDKLLAAQNIN